MFEGRKNKSQGVLLQHQPQHFFYLVISRAEMSKFEMLMGYWGSVFACSMLLSDNGLGKFIRIVYEKRQFCRIHFFRCCYYYFERDSIQQGEVINMYKHMAQIFIQSKWNSFFFLSSLSVLFILFSACLLLFRVLYTKVSLQTERNTVEW